MLTGCVAEDLMMDDLASGHGGLMAYVDNGTKQTRMTVSDLGETSPGEEAMNENLLVTIDAFFYTHAANKAEAAVHHVFDKINRQNTWTMTQGVSVEKLKQMFDVETLTAGDFCTVYILANYGATADGKSKFTGTESRETLQQLALEADFNPKGTDGKVVPQDYFVMEGTAAAELTGQGIYTLTGEVPLRRVAAKVRLAVTIDPTAANGVTDANNNVWVPQPETMKVMMVHGVNKGIVCTEDGSYRYSYPAEDAPIYYPKETEAEERWTVYGRDMDQTTVKDGATWYEHEVPFYSYPSLDWKNNPDNEAYLSFSMRWKQQADETKGTVTYYQIPIAQRQTEPSLALKSYRYYRTEMVLGVMGSFTPDDPVELTDNSYIIVDWGVNDTEHVDNATVKPSMSEVAFLSVQAGRDTLNNVASHGVEYSSSHPVTATLTKIEFYSYYDTSNTDRFLRVVYERNGNSWRRTVYDGVTGAQVTGNGYASNNAGNPFTATNTEYKGFPLGGYSVNTDNNMITLIHEIPEGQFSSANITVEVSNGMSTEEIVFTQLPSIYLEAERSNGYVFVNNYSQTNNGTRTVYDNDNNSIGTLAQRASITGGGGTNNNRNNYYINISSFGPNDSYVLGDPRESTVTSIDGIPTSSYHQTRETGTEDMIAPSFMIASSYGKTQYSGFTYEMARKRCAAYQENGYPAGRWRVPTLAEIKYIVELSVNSKIPSLFQFATNDNEGYWSANGRAITQNGVITLPTNNAYQANNTAVRCIYDTWYWGAEPYQQNATTWLNYQD